MVEAWKRVLCTLTNSSLGSYQSRSNHRQGCQAPARGGGHLASVMSCIHRAQWGLILRVLYFKNTCVSLSPPGHVDSGDQPGSGACILESHSFSICTCTRSPQIERGRCKIHCFKRQLQILHEQVKDRKCSKELNNKQSCSGRYYNIRPKGFLTTERKALKTALNGKMGSSLSQKTQ